MKLTEFTYLNEVYQSPEDKVVLVGMAHDGPIQRPFMLEEHVDVDTMLGDNELANAYKELELNNVSRNNIIIYRLNGIYGEAIFKTEDGKEYFKIRTVSACSENKLIELNVLPTGIVVTKYKTVDEYVELDDLGNPTNKTTVIDYQLTYIYSDYTYIYELADDINKDSSLGLSDIIAKEMVDGYTSDYFKEQRRIYLDTADSEKGFCLNNRDFFENYKPLYWDKFYKGVIGEDFQDGIFNTRLSNIKCEAMVFTDVYYDLFPEVGTYAARLCYQIQDEQDLYVSAIIGVSPPPEEDEIPEGYILISGNKYYNELGEEIFFDKRGSIRKYISHLKTVATNEEREKEAYMENLQVVAGTALNLDGTRYYSVIGGYAGVYIKTDRFIPVTNKKIHYENSIDEKIYRSDIASLTNYGYIYIVPSIRKGFVAYRAQSFETKDGILNQLNNKRLYGVIKKDIRTILDGYIGKHRHDINVPQLSRFFEEYFDNMLNKNYINNYTYELPSQQKWDSYDRYDLKIELVLYGEIYKINSNFSVNPKDEGGITVWETIND